MVCTVDNTHAVTQHLEKATFTKCILGIINFVFIKKKTLAGSNIQNCTKGWQPVHLY